MLDPVNSVLRPTRWTWLGRQPYARTSSLQVEVREALRRGEGPERLLLLEHPAVFSLGRNATAADVLWSSAELALRRVDVQTSDRGGQVTFHGPGQLVGYPILDLSPDRRDVRRYVQNLQEVLVRTLAGFGIAADGGAGETIGVWVGPRKIASIGIHLSRWRTTHGFALNVDPDLELFRGIVACGMPSVEMTSIARECGEAPPVAKLAESLLHHFAAIFERRLELDPDFPASSAGPRSFSAPRDSA
ncbi:MAG: lipoyl(octanoyl) transferase LipB [Thermoanaerobaculia bacterium]